MENKKDYSYVLLREAAEIIKEYRDYCDDIHYVHNVPKWLSKYKSHLSLTDRETENNNLNERRLSYEVQESINKHNHKTLMQLAFRLRGMFNYEIKDKEVACLSIYYMLRYFNGSLVKLGYEPKRKKVSKPLEKRRNYTIYNYFKVRKTQQINKRGDETSDYWEYRQALDQIKPRHVLVSRIMANKYEEQLSTLWHKWTGTDPENAKEWNLVYQAINTYKNYKTGTQQTVIKFPNNKILLRINAEPTIDNKYRAVISDTRSNLIKTCKREHTFAAQAINEGLDVIHEMLTDLVKNINLRRMKNGQKNRRYDL